jgi:hypothetical protein
MLPCAAGCCIRRGSMPPRIMSIGTPCCCCCCIIASHATPPPLPAPARSPHEEEPQR